MRFKAGDKVVVQKRIDGNPQMQDLAGEVVTITEVDRVHEIYLIREDEESNIWPEESFERLATEEEIQRQYMFEKLGALESNAKIPVSADPLATKIEERNNKPSIQDRLPEELEKLLADEPHNPIKPAHYRKGEIDLFESWYRTYPFNEFRAGMQMIAERYMKRDKHDRVEDIKKSIETLTRLKEYEELEE